ncbi:MAG: DNA polymerase III subunit gamma/tau [Clostridia bacterium]
MAYLALYRKYRPIRFADVVGQDATVRILQHAVAEHRVSHAYLFCGSRGTGKTSSARILARAVNCLEPDVGEPCNKCSSCLAIESGSAMDVIEIDAASNRGIDEIRSLRERIGLSPIQGRYKVYIIDEVHMLTGEAFNAFLKTLEEPPNHVIFILATTEPQKLPATILSRCQRFDFRRISDEKIRKRMDLILVENKVAYEDEALFLIARLALGGMRDALSLLDQCISTGTECLTAKLVEEVAGIVSEDWLELMVIALVETDKKTILNQIYLGLSAGKEVHGILSNLLMYLRNILLASMGNDAKSLVAVSEESFSRLEKLSKRIGKNNLMLMLERLGALEKELRNTSNAFILLEVALLRLTGELSGEMAAPTSLMQQQAVSEKGKSAPSAIEKKVEVKEPIALKKQTPMQARGEKQGLVEVEQDLVLLWQSVLDKLKDTNRMLEPFYREAFVTNLLDNTLTIEFPVNKSFHFNRGNKQDAKAQVELVLNQISAKELKLHCCLQIPKDTKEMQEEDPMVKRAKEIFGENIVNIIDD